MINLAGVNSLTVSKVFYCKVLSATRPVPHCEKISVPVFHTLKNLADEMLSSSGNFVDKDKNEDFSGDLNPQMPVLFNQRAINDLVCDLDPTKIAAELLASR